MLNPKLVIICIVASFVSITPRGAEAQNVQRCVYEAYSGGNPSNVMSWLGRRFEVNPQTGIVTVVFPNNQVARIAGSPVRANNFITYRHEETITAEGNESFRTRYSFRIYNDGRCSARADFTGYMPFVADGVWR